MVLYYLLFYFVFTAMALCDMFTLLFPAPGLLYMFTFGNHYKPLAPVAACYAWNAFNEVSGTLHSHRAGRLEIVHLLYWSTAHMQTLYQRRNSTGEALA